ncbi:MAG: 1-acyl-sn-glycerol-3-phosphate acyltransferase [Bdellovibrionales bacterium]|nr:1-acyl-sn-glycerol-3-phosphate acyltransferase [Bdellovibrionales bacterium]
MKKWEYQNQQWTQLPPHLRHLPLISQNPSLFERAIEWIWAYFLKRLFFRFYIKLDVKGSFREIYEKHPKLIIISNHSSHLDAISIAAAIPLRYWHRQYSAAAKDYFFSNPWISYFSKHCIRAIPIDRKGRNGEAIRLCMRMLTDLKEIWMILFPEGTRTPDGYIHTFKRGVSVFAQKSDTPILFLYLENANNLWPKGQGFAKRGKLTVHIGPVQPPAEIDEVFKNYKNWVDTIEPNRFKV